MQMRLEQAFNYLNLCTFCVAFHVYAISVDRTHCFDAISMDFLAQKQDSCLDLALCFLYLKILGILISYTTVVDHIKDCMA